MDTEKHANLGETDRYRDPGYPAREGANRRRAGLAAAFTLVFCLAPGLGMSNALAFPGANFTVGATVLPRTAIVARSAPPVLVILPSDIERGFVEVPVAAEYEITSTSADGFALDFWPTTTVVSAIVVRSGGTEALLDANGGTIVQRGRRGLSIPLLLQYRFYLVPGTVPGRYPWPVHVDARALTGA
ncbi:MAG: hypothetical protein JSR15_06605 [Proteobacteria bacterium]|nr:hypothetical protein [Pseudomonadota bacterium]